MLFYLGTHEPHWLTSRAVDVPLFVSRRRLARKTPKGKSRVRWALDSGGFTELSMKGRWGVSASQYVREAREWSESLGSMDWAAPQDWMVEPWILEKTGFSIETHQRLTIASVVELRFLAPDIHWIPVLQGWTVKDYHQHLDMYQRAGFDLEREPIVGVGSVCRRQATDEALEIFQTLQANGLKLHGFGLKTQGLRKSGPWLASADSLAWSYNARKHPPLPGCKHAHCNNCPRWALRWREKVLAG